MRKVLALIVLTGIHLAMSLGLMFSSIGSAMGRFDDGQKAAPVERVVEAASDVLLFPVVNGLADLAFSGLRGLSTVGQYSLFAANSLVWAVTVLAIWTVWKRWRVEGAVQPAVAGGRGPRLRSEPRR